MIWFNMKCVHCGYIIRNPEVDAMEFTQCPRCGIFLKTTSYNQLEEK